MEKIDRYKEEIDMSRITDYANIGQNIFKDELKLIKMKWMLFYLIILDLIEIIFMMPFDNISLFIDILLMFSLIYDFYFLNKFQFLPSDQKVLHRCKSKANIFFIGFILDVIITSIFNPDGLISYDEYDKFFAYTYIINSAVKIFILKYLNSYIKTIIVTNIQ